MEMNKRKLLLVDDDPSLLETLGDFLSFEGYDVLCAVSGEDALVKMRPFQPDLIILDMGMPGMGGTGFLDRITNPDGHTLYPVLVLTARASMAEYFANKQIAGFFAKPCDPPDLLMEVSRILFETANAGHVAASAPALRRLVVAESDPALRQTLEVEFTQAGFEVKAVETGPEALEACVTLRPHAIVMRLELEGMSADEVIAMLRRLPTTRETRAVVYGMDLPEAQLEHVANLDVPQNCMLKDLTVNTIIDRTMAVTGA
ncbi:MAG TPA: response regulator [Kiritimatiellia bacterium]|mgnify:CR=1 FL=1|nr:response regulator [Kiritimatiellia bacterium]HRU69960.1 response regulator [Kiritimatiellia bacterium]